MSVFAWAPDGSRIAYRPAQRDELWAMTADGSDAHLVDASISDPSWSPDGTLLLGQGSDGLFTIRPDGTDRTVLTPGLTLEEPRPAQLDAIDHYRPAWQPLIDEAG